MQRPLIYIYTYIYIYIYTYIEAWAPGKPGHCPVQVPRAAPHLSTCVMGHSLGRVLGPFLAPACTTVTQTQTSCCGAQPGARVGAIRGPNVPRCAPNTAALWHGLGSTQGHPWPCPPPPVPHATAGELGPSLRGRPQVASAPLTSPLLGASPRSPVRRSQPRRPGTMACLHAGIYILVFRVGRHARLFCFCRCAIKACLKT